MFDWNCGNDVFECFFGNVSDYVGVDIFWSNVIYGYFFMGGFLCEGFGKFDDICFCGWVVCLFELVFLVIDWGDVYDFVKVGVVYIVDYLVGYVKIIV